MRIQRVTSATAAFLLLLAVAVGGAWADQTGQPAPKLVVEKNTHSFEAVVDGTVVSHDFLVRNEGDKVLELSKVKTG